MRSKPESWLTDVTDCHSLPHVPLENEKVYHLGRWSLFYFLWTCVLSFNMKTVLSIFSPIYLELNRQGCAFLVRLNVYNFYKN